MGWKSTIDMTREEMEGCVRSEMDDRPASEYTDEQLSDMLEAMRGGEKHGHSYRVVREQKEQTKEERQP